MPTQYLPFLKSIIEHWRHSYYAGRHSLKNAEVGGIIYKEGNYIRYLQHNPTVASKSNEVDHTAGIEDLMYFNAPKVTARVGTSHTHPIIAGGMSMPSVVDFITYHSGQDPQGTTKVPSQIVSRGKIPDGPAQNKVLFTVSPTYQSGGSKDRGTIWFFTGGLAGTQLISMEWR